MNNKISIIIEDDGIGMNDEEIALALSGQGNQIDKSSLESTGKIMDSHGIGFPIVKQLVALLGGELRIISEKGKGTRIGIILG